jgi:hypothetical protein
MLNRWSEVSLLRPAELGIEWIVVTGAAADDGGDGFAKAIEHFVHNDNRSNEQVQVAQAGGRA